MSKNYQRHGILRARRVRNKRARQRSLAALIMALKRKPALGREGGRSARHMLRQAGGRWRANIARKRRRSRHAKAYEMENLQTGGYVN